MHCPFCGVEDTRVVDSRLVAGGAQVRRRRACNLCHERFTTYESAELLMPHVVKSNGVREPFNEGKLRAGLQKALEKRPVSTEQVERAIGTICHRLRASGEREIPSGEIGEAVMDALRDLDAVAYVRFASVYRQFEDICAFRKELDELEKQ
ncbi:MAG: transcriptional regulator NrdR [Cellvibrionales bacterium]|nr:transcriptional regulator NrdR [Cellvibrionales bacterium]